MVAKSFKGYHVYLRVVGESVRNQKVAFNETGNVLIEIKGEGGVIQAPPSIHPTGCQYQWRQGSHTQLPWLTGSAYEHLLTEAQALDRRPKKKPVTKAELNAWRVVNLPKSDDELTDRLNRYAEAAMASECAGLAKLARGSRNDELNKAAFRLGRFVGAGLLDDDKVCHGLLQASEANGYIEDDGLEAFTRTILSGLSAGKRLGDAFLTKLHLQINITTGNDCG